MPWIAEFITNGETGDSNQFVITSNEPEEFRAKYNLTFVNGKGILEVSRMILAYAGVPFTDTRLSYQQWISRMDGKFTYFLFK